MAARDILLNNLRWKITALLLALLVWVVIKFAIYREATGGRNQILRHQPVMVLKAPGDPSLFRLDPPYVDVVLQSSKEMVGDDLAVFVNVVTMPEVNTALKQVLVRVSDSTRVRAEPAFVLVERVALLDASTLTNTFRKP
jgi:hypothetical protein